SSTRFQLSDAAFSLAEPDLLCAISVIDVVCCPRLPGAISRELLDASLSICCHIRCCHSNSMRIDLSRRSGLSLVPTRKRLGLSRPLPFLELRTMYGNRIRHLLILRDQPALRLCVPAARRLAGAC